MTSTGTFKSPSLLAPLICSTQIVIILSRDRPRRLLPEPADCVSCWVSFVWFLSKVLGLWYIFNFTDFSDYFFCACKLRHIRCVRWQRIEGGGEREEVRCPGRKKAKINSLYSSIIHTGISCRSDAVVSSRTQCKKAVNHSNLPV